MRHFYPLSLVLWKIPLYPKKCIDQYDSVFVMEVGLLILIIIHLNWALEILEKGHFSKFPSLQQGQYNPEALFSHKLYARHCDALPFSFNTFSFHPAAQSPIKQIFTVADI